MSAAGYQFQPHERPLFPGSPYTPQHSVERRIAYALVGTFIGACTTFTNSLVNVNAAVLGGSLDLTLAQVSALPAMYVAFNATGNLSLVRARAQFGIPRLTLTLVFIYALAALLQLTAPGYITAILTRATCGLMAAGLTTLTIYYFFQALPAAVRPLGLVIGIGLLQLGTPLARVVPLEVLATGSWHGLSLIELGVAMSVGAVIMAVPLPPSDCTPAFEKLDFVTIGLMVAGYVLLCLVLSEGRLLWWSDRAWLGWALTASVVLIATAIAVEHNRKRRLLYTDWIGRGEALRLFLVALLVRLALAEQTYGSVGFLTSGGLTSDQLHTLFIYVAIAVVLGIVAACVTFSEKSPRYQILGASLIIAVGAYMDGYSTSVTRPEQLYLSQSLIGFGTTLFIGPALGYGFLQMMRQGGTHLVSLIVAFSTTQNVGALAGSAILGTAQILYVRAHAAALGEGALASDPQVATRLQQGAGVVSSTLGDPVLRAAEGATILGRSLNVEATTLAFNDVFRLVMWASLATAAWLAWMLVAEAWRKQSKPGVAT